MSKDLGIYTTKRDSTEWGPDDGQAGRRSWNRITGGHGRKFVLNPGTWLRDGRPERVEDLAFWCEWEAPSRKTEPLNPDRQPRFVHRPWLEIPEAFDCLQNTDPCVFGGFFYTGCRQHRGHHPTRLHDLAPGSVVAFGSSIGKEFHVDTVFVVAGSILHETGNWEARLRGEVPAEYLDLTIRPWYAECSEPGCLPIEPPDAEGYRLYFGATHDKPVDGMYSFFPASTMDRHPQGFERPEIHPIGPLEDAINGQLQAYKFPAGPDTEARALWEEVQRQVLAAGLGIGVGAEMPPSAQACG